MRENLFTPKYLQRNIKQISQIQYKYKHDFKPKIIEQSVNGLNLKDKSKIYVKNKAIQKDFNFNSKEEEDKFQVKLNKTFDDSE